MQPTTQPADWFELVGAVPQQESTPRFLDLIFKEILPKWQGDDGRRFVQRINGQGVVEGMAEIDPYLHHVLLFPGTQSQRKSIKIGDVAFYALQFQGLLAMEEVDVITGFHAACESAFSEENMKRTSANPFFGLALAQAINSTELEVQFSKLAFGILQIANPVLAQSWFADRRLSDHAISAIMKQMALPAVLSNRSGDASDGRHLKVAILSTIRNPSLGNRYFLEDGLLISFHIGDVGFLFRGRTASYDAVVAPLANFDNGEDLGNICKIATVPHSPSKTMLESSSLRDFARILVSDQPDLAEEIKQVVIEKCPG